VGRKKIKRIVVLLGRENGNLLLYRRGENFRQQKISPRLLSPENIWEERGSKGPNIINNIEIERISKVMENGEISNF
jgi:hypothetical protein